MLLALEEPFRSTVMLRYFEGLSSSEIARQAEIPASTVRWRLKRGLDTIRCQLDGEHGGDRGVWIAVLVPIADAGNVATSSSTTNGTPRGRAMLSIGVAALVLSIGGLLAFDARTPDEVETTGTEERTAGLGTQTRDDSLGAEGAPPILVGHGAAPHSANTRSGDVSSGAAASTLKQDSVGADAHERAAGAPEKSQMRIRIVGPDDRPVPKVRLTVLTGTARRGSSVRHEVVEGLHVADKSHWGPRTELWVLNPRDERGEPLPLGPAYVGEVDRAKDELTIRLTLGRQLVGQVVDHEDRPVSGVRITVRRPQVRGQAGFAGTARSDESGRFLIEALPAEPLEVVPYLRNSSWPDADPLPLGVEQAEVVVRLPRPSTFRVLVHGPDAQPVEGLIAHVSWSNRGVYRYRRGVTNSEGLATLAGVNTRLPLVVHVLADTRHPELPGFKQTGVSFGDGEFIVRLGADAVIQGHVVDADGKPVLSGEVVAEGGSDHTTTFTARVVPDAATGAFTMRVKPGIYRVWLRDSPGLADTRPATVRTPAAQLRIVAGPATEAHGRLHVKEPQRWHVVWIRESKSKSAVIDPDGRFRVLGVGGEPAAVLATRHADPRVALLEGVSPTDGPFDIRPVAGQRISGRVEGLKTAQGAVVRISRGPVHLLARVESDMSFSIDNAPGGVWQLELLQHHVSRCRIEQVVSGTEDLHLVIDR